MNSANQPIVLVIGGTGAMGSRVVRRLAERSKYRVRVLTRDKSGAGARRAAELPKTALFEGDASDPASIANAIEGVSGVFCNTDYWTAWSDDGTNLETEWGVAILEAARSAGVNHFIYSSAEHVEAVTSGKLSVPHFDAKGRVADYIWDRRQAGDAWYAEHVSILTTAPYTENFMTYFLPRDVGDASDPLKVFSLPLGDAAWTMVALEDIAEFAHLMFGEPDKWRGHDLAIASDRLTISELVDTFTSVTGIKARYEPMDLESFRENVSDDLANMFAFIREYGLKRDLVDLRELHPGLRNFEIWLRETGWQGEPRDIQALIRAEKDLEEAK